MKIDADEIRLHRKAKNDANGPSGQQCDEMMQSDFDCMPGPFWVDQLLAGRIKESVGGGRIQPPPAKDETKRAPALQTGTRAYNPTGSHFSILNRI